MPKWWEEGEDKAKKTEVISSLKHDLKMNLFSIQNITFYTFHIFPSFSPASGVPFLNPPWCFFFAHLPSIFARMLTLIFSSKETSSHPQKNWENPFWIHGQVLKRLQNLLGFKDKQRINSYQFVLGSYSICIGAFWMLAHLWVRTLLLNSKWAYMN